MQTKIPQKLQEKWERRLADENLRPLDGVNGFGHWTFSGGQDPAPGERNRHSKHVSLEAINGALHKQQTTYGAEEDGDTIYLAQTPNAEFWRIVGTHANNLPRNYKHRAMLVEISERGTVADVAREHKLSKRRGEWVWRKFLVEVCDLPPPKTTVPGRTCNHEENPASSPARTLSRAELKKLSCTPPKSIPDTQADLDHPRKQKKHPQKRPA